MITYPIPMVPGPVSVPQEVLQQYLLNYGSGDLETEFLELYNRTEVNLQALSATRNRVAIQSGEGMLVLWGALKSCLLPGDQVVSIATGVFGYGIAEMAKAIGANVHTIGLPYNKTLFDLDEVEKAIIEFRPKMITAVHCETPSGTLNPLAALGSLKRKYAVPLFYVDAVASLGGTPVLTDEWSIDLSLGGSQKCLSAPPGMAFVAVSDKAWEIIAEMGYQGYDALLPYQLAQENFFFPYTPYWHGLAALCTASEILLREGLENSYNRHNKCAAACREGLIEAGLTLYAATDAIPSPTVTAVNVPEWIEWQELDARFRRHGLVVGGSYGPLAGKVFRLGHMGTQADPELVEKAVGVIHKVIQENGHSRL